jgi:hypothetical protein
VSLENPAVPLSAIDEDDPLYDALTGGAGRSASGVRVTRGRALGLSAVWRGVNLIAGDVGRHAFRVYRYEGDGLIADARHQAALVMRKPNDYMTPFTFRQTLQSHALLDGNGYAYIVRDPITSAPLELLPLTRTGRGRCGSTANCGTSSRLTSPFPAGGGSGVWSRSRLPTCSTLRGWGSTGCKAIR